MIDLNQAMDFLIAREGGYVNDPADPGGETRWGISKRAYPNEDIKNLTLERAKELYTRDYWLKAGCDQLPSPLNLVVLDSAANLGVSRAKDWANKATNWEDYLWLRLGAYVAIVKGRPTSVKFLSGWCKRVILLREACKASLRSP